MALLDIFSPEERTMVVSLPYVAGLWVSCCDNEGGQFSSMEEMIALEDMIRKMTKGMFESAFVHEVMAETFTRKEEWRSWAEANMADTIGLCGKVIKLLHAKGLPTRDIDAYRRIVMQLGLEVARAFREFDTSEPALYKIIRWVGLMVDKFFGAMSGEGHISANILNVSYKEDVALNALATALRGEGNHQDMITNS